MLNIVDQVHILGEVTQEPEMEIMKDVDGIDVTVTATCAVCGNPMKLHKAGVLGSVKQLMQTQSGTTLDILAMGKSDADVLQIMVHRAVPQKLALSTARAFKF